MSSVEFDVVLNDNNIICFLVSKCDALTILLAVLLDFLPSWWISAETCRGGAGLPEELIEEVLHGRRGGGQRGDFPLLCQRRSKVSNKPVYQND